MKIYITDIDGKIGIIQLNIKESEISIEIKTKRIDVTIPVLCSDDFEYQIRYTNNLNQPRHCTQLSPKITFHLLGCIDVHL